MGIFNFINEIGGNILFKNKDGMMIFEDLDY